MVSTASCSATVRSDALSRASQEAYCRREPNDDARVGLESVGGI